MNFRELNQEAVDNFARTGRTMLPGYGVEIDTDPLNDWRCIMVHHLTGAENRGRNHVYFEVLEADGRRATGLKIGWTWKGRKQHEAHPPVLLNKSHREPAGNMPILAGQVVTLAIYGKHCDRVRGLHTMHTDEEQGNMWGHHSFYVVYQKVGRARPDSADDVLERIESKIDRLAEAVLGGGHYFAS